MRTIEEMEADIKYYKPKEDIKEVVKEVHRAMTQDEINTILNHYDDESHFLWLRNPDTGELERAYIYPDGHIKVVNSKHRKDNVVCM